jgi:hypothetical protein
MQQRVCLALPCSGFELVTIIACARTQQHMHPQQQQTGRQQQHSSLGLSHARDVFAREYSVIIDVCACRRERRSPRRDWLGRILPGRAGQGEGGQRAWAWELGQPPCRSPPAGRVQHPCAGRWPWGGEVVSQQKRAEKASFRLAARLLAACVLTQAALHLSRTPHNRIAQHQHQHQQKQQQQSIIILSRSIGASKPVCACLPACFSDTSTRCPSASPHRGTPVHRIAYPIAHCIA